jgi:hypothetical protein
MGGQPSASNCSIVCCTAELGAVTISRYPRSAYRLFEIDKHSHIRYNYGEKYHNPFYPSGALPFAVSHKHPLDIIKLSIC